MNLFLTLAMPWLQAFALAAVTVVVPLAYRKGAAVLEAHKIDSTVYQAIGRAGGEAFRVFQTLGGDVTNRASLSTAAAAGGAYLATQVPAALAVKGITDPVEMGKLAGAEMGRLLALNPPLVAGTVMEMIPGVSLG